MQENKVALVTGANKGIGFEIARQLGKRGLTVLLGARDAGRGEKAASVLRAEGLDVRFVQLDVTSAGSIAAAAKATEEGFGRLDVLVNNAGITLHPVPPATDLSMEQIRTIYDTNFFGVIAVTRALLPLLKRAKAARIVNVSSGLGSLTLMSKPDSPYAAFNSVGYSASKTALNGVTVALAHELRASGIKVNAADPGYTATDINNHSGPRTVEEGSRAAVRLATLGEDGPTGSFFNEDGVVAW